MRARDVIGTRIGRRLILLVVSAGFVPMLLLALVLYFRTSAMLEDEALRYLSGSARTAHSELRSTLALAKTRLAEWQDADSIPARTELFSRLWLLDRDLSLSAVVEPAPRLELGPVSRVMLEQGHAVFSAPYVIGSSIQSSVAVIVKRRDGGQRGEGRYLAGEIHPAALWDVTRASRYSAYDALVITDRDGRILAASTEYDLFSLFEARPKTDLVSTPSPANRGLGVANRAGEASYWAQEEIELERESDLKWKITATRSARAMQGAFDDLAREYAICLLLFLMLLFLLTVRFSRRLLTPILGLHETMIELARGNWLVRANEAGRDEFGELAQAFNLMAGELNRYHDRQIQLAGEASIGRLASRVAHEVNNPLAAIKLQLSIIKKNLTAPQQTVIERVDGEINRIARTLHGLLEFSRPQELRIEPLSIARVVDSVAQLFDAGFESQGITLHVNTKSAPPVVVGDDDQIQQVVVNLLENARDAVSTGGNVWLTVEMRDATGAGGAEACIVVEDDGHGIQEDAEKMFQIFYTTKASGSGLGLAIARRIAEAHEGTLTGESRRPVGARFCFAIPVREGVDGKRESRGGIGGEEQKAVI